jgi:hypothetical protein
MTGQVIHNADRQPGVSEQCHWNKGTHLPEGEGSAGLEVPVTCSVPCFTGAPGRPHQWLPPNCERVASKVQGWDEDRFPIPGSCLQNLEDRQFKSFLSPSCSNPQTLFLQTTLKVTTTTRTSTFFLFF